MSIGWGKGEGEGVEKEGGNTKVVGGKHRIISLT